MQEAHPVGVKVMGHVPAPEGGVMALGIGVQSRWAHRELGAGCAAPAQSVPSVDQGPAAATAGTYNLRKSCFFFLVFLFKFWLFFFFLSFFYFPHSFFFFPLT